MVVWKFGVCQRKKEWQHTAILEMDQCCQEEVEELWKEVACRMEIDVQKHWWIAGKAMKAFMGRGGQPKCSEEKVAEKVLRRRKEIFSEEHKRKQWKQSRQWWIYSSISRSMVLCVKKGRVDWRSRKSGQKLDDSGEIWNVWVLGRVV